MRRAAIVAAVALPALVAACARESTSVPPVNPTEAVPVSPFALEDGAVVSEDAGPATALPDASGVDAFDAADAAAR